MATNSDSPGHIRGIFQTSLSVADVRGWRYWIERNSKGALDFGLDEVTLCKCKDGKEHEFLLLRFRWKNTSKVAFLTVDRVPAEITTAGDSSRNAHRSSVLTTPSIHSTLANDVVHVIPENENHEKEVSKIYHSYDKLCKLEFPLLDARPSPLQVSVLLDVVNCHAPIYDLYEKQCYWFSNTVFDMLLKLFPGSKEICSKHGRRGHYSILSIAKQDSVDAVCEEYNVEWQKEQDKSKIEEDKRREAEENNRRLQEERDQADTRAAQADTRAAQADTRAAQFEAELQKRDIETARFQAELHAEREKRDIETARFQAELQAEREKRDIETAKLQAQLAAALGQDTNKGLEQAVAANQSI